MHRIQGGPQLRALPFFALIMLTSLDGKPVLVESTAIVVIRSQSHECGPGHGAVIRVGSSALCVRETPDEIREKIDAAVDR